MKLFFFGAGYCSEFIAPLIPKHWTICGTHQKLPNRPIYKNHPYIKRYTFNFFLKNKKKFFEKTSHFLVSIPPDNKGDLIIREIRDLLIGNKNLKWIGYFSTTGVYGDHGGRWVDENTKVNPSNQRAKLRLVAEKQFLDLYDSYKLPIHIFRLPGIYGPKRSVFDRIKNGKTNFVKKENHFFSRIHVKDIASCVFKSMKNPTPGEIFNITDDKPSPSQDVTKFAYKLMKMKLPEFIESDNIKLSGMAKSFYLDNKKVSNKKVKNALNWKPSFPEYKIGLKEIYQIGFNIKK